MFLFLKSDFWTLLPSASNTAVWAQKEFQSRTSTALSFPAWDGRTEPFCSLAQTKHHWENMHSSLRKCFRTTFYQVLDSKNREVIKEPHQSPKNSAICEDWLHVVLLIRYNQQLAALWSTLPSSFSQKRISPDTQCTHFGGGGLVAKSCPTLETPQTVARQASLSMGFSRQEYWSGLPLLDK